MADEPRRKRRGSNLDRMAGNVQPEVAFNEEEAQSREVEPQVSRLTVQVPAGRAKDTYNYQKVNIKVSKYQGDEIDAVIRLNNMKFRYEAIQFLVDFYKESLSTSDKRRFDNLVGN